MTAKPVAAAEPKAVHSMPVTVTAGAQVPGQLPTASQGIPQGSRGTPHSWPLQVGPVSNICPGTWAGCRVRTKALHA